jgi:hypothetical protein
VLYKRGSWPFEEATIAIFIGFNSTFKVLSAIEARVIIDLLLL